jgi:hypothetical protein
MTAVGGAPRPSRRGGAIVLVTSAGAATGSRAAAAALAAAGSGPDRAGLLIDLTPARPPGPSLIATAAARALEERLAVHLPEAAVASRGAFCRLGLPAERSGLDGAAAALPLVRDSLAVVHLPPRLLRETLDDPRIEATAVLLRADLPGDRALTALAARDLIGRGLRVAVLKRPLGWISARAALFGAFPIGGGAFPDRLCGRLLETDDSKFRHCYVERNGAEGDQEETLRQEWRRPARAHRRQEVELRRERQGRK